jgi:DNA-binding response OmpR family regulator
MTLSVYRGRKILIVEDEALIAMLLEQMLAELGLAVIGPIGKLSDAAAMARDGTFDAALLDLNIDGGESYGVAQILRERGIAFAFTSGSAVVDPAWADAPKLPKPFFQPELEAVLAQLLG